MWEKGRKFMRINGGKTLSVYDSDLRGRIAPRASETGVHGTRRCLDIVLSEEGFTKDTICVR